MKHLKYGKRAAFLLVILLMTLSACTPAATDALPQDSTPLQDAAPQSEPAPVVAPSPTAAEVAAEVVENAPEDNPEPIIPTDASPTAQENPTAIPPTATNPPATEEAASINGPSFSGTVGSAGGLYGEQDLSVVATTGKLQFLNVYANW